MSSLRNSYCYEEKLSRTPLSYWHVELVDTQKTIRQKAKKASKSQLEDILFKLCTELVKNNYNADSYNALNIMSRVIEDWHPVNLSIVKEITDNDDTEYKDNKRVKSKIIIWWEKLKVIPLPIKLYIPVFGLGIIIFSVLLYLQIKENLFLWNPIYTIFGIIGCVGLFITACLAIGDWNKKSRS